MGEDSKIQWTDNTQNFWYGCTKISSGCKNCYAERWAKRTGNDFNIVNRTSKKTFEAPLKWKEPALVFTCSLGDFFHEDADEWREDAWDIIRRTPHLTYQILTKRPDNIHNRLPRGWPFKNVWLGVTVEDPKSTWRLNSLENIEAYLRFISYEPALAPVCFLPWLGSGEYGWLISGGESGPNARVADPSWFTAVRNGCRRHGIPYFHKQNGGSKKINGAYGGAELEGRLWQEMPSGYNR